jgi:hypothetical protein
MLDPWIIEEIRRREEDRKREESRPSVVVDLPIPEQPRPGSESVRPTDDEVVPRGVTIIDFGVGDL